MKKIFILANKMNSGGTEVALLSLLNELVKYKEISITLGLLRKEGVYLGKIPKEVKVVEIFSEQQMKYFETIKKNPIAKRKIRYCCRFSWIWIHRNRLFNRKSKCKKNNNICAW